MIQGSEDRYLRMAGGLYVAWPLTVPSAWGEWVLVEWIVPSNSRDRLPTIGMQINPQRALVDEEVWIIKSRPVLFWGMKVMQAPWALVMCREVVTSPIKLPKRTGPTNTTRAIGV